MRITIKESDPCPCESGKRVAECCWRPDGTLIPWATRTWPSGPKTGYANPKCYAAILADCCHSVNREHFISESVLKLMAPDGKIGVSGFPWQTAEESKIVGIANLTGKILCNRHNEALSALDTVAKRLYSKFQIILEEFNSPSLKDVSRCFLFCGNDIERWMLKILCGVIMSRNNSESTRSIMQSIPEQWIHILYGLKAFPETWGLYFVSRRGEEVPVASKIQWTLFPNETSTAILGIEIRINDFGFVLAMATPPPDTANTVFERAVYRPGGLSFSNAKKRTLSEPGRKTIEIGWYGNGNTWIDIQHRHKVGIHK